MDACTNPDILRIILYITQILKAVFIIVPIGLIIMMALDFFKNVTASREEDMKKNAMIAIKRIIYCACIFFVPTIVGLVNSILGDLQVSYTVCLDNANVAYIEERTIAIAREYLTTAKTTPTMSNVLDAQTAIEKIDDDSLREELLEEVESLKENVIDEAEQEREEQEEQNEIIPSTGGGSSDSGSGDSGLGNAGTGGTQSPGSGNAKGTLTSPINPTDSNATFLSRMGGNSRTLYYLSGTYHGGSDVPVSTGTTVYAMDGGTVYAAAYASGSGGANPGGYGNYIIINHNNGYYTLYAHLSGVSISSGDKVSQGQKIGLSGNTGNSTGPHLHIELITKLSPLGRTANCSHILTLDYIGTGKSYVGAKGYCK